MNLKDAIINIENFPAPGILFRDLNPLWENKILFKEMIDQMAEQIRPLNPTQLVALEARGFIVASALAYSLGIGLSLIRKKGKLPGKLFTAGYKNEYTFTGDVEMQANALKSGDKVILVDDILATGKSTISCLEILNKFENIEILAVAYIVELVELNARERLKDLIPVISLIQD